jgi:lipoprotein-releasing system ATP-binding protein
MIIATDIRKSYQTPGETIDVLRGLSLDLPTATTAAIVGPSGCGKTTLLNLLGALDQPTSGRIEIDGEDISEFDATRAAAFRNHKLGFVFQQHHLLPQLSVIENVLVPRLAGDWQESENDTRQRAAGLLDQVGLSARLDHRPWQLSGGEKLRTAVARALINEPALILADEPTGSLDPSGSDVIADLLIELNRHRQTTLLVVTHNHDLARRMDHTYELREGALHSF